MMFWVSTGSCFNLARYMNDHSGWCLMSNWLAEWLVSMSSCIDYYVLQLLESFSGLLCIFVTAQVHH